jgi:hypothetical protein
MVQGLGALGFWLGVGIVLAAMIVSGAIKDGLKEREKAREKQAMLRALLERAGEHTPEVLAYLREKDAAGAKLGREEIGLLGAISVFFLAFLGGGACLLALAPPGRHEPAARDPLVALAPIGVMIGVWAAGLVIAWLIVHLTREHKHGAGPDA